MKSINSKIQNSVQIQLRNNGYLSIRASLYVGIQTLINDITIASNKINWKIADII